MRQAAQPIDTRCNPFLRIGAQPERALKDHVEDEQHDGKTQPTIREHPVDTLQRSAVLVIRRMAQGLVEHTVHIGPVGFLVAQITHMVDRVCGRSGLVDGLLDEVKARIKAILRRTASRGTVREAEKPDVVVSGDLKLYREDRRFEIEEREIKLTSKEFELLDLLMTHPGKVYGREKLLQLVWGADFPGDERTVDVHIRRLREKIEPNPSEPIYVQTKWGVGYYYKEHAAKA